MFTESAGQDESGRTKVLLVAFGVLIAVALVGVLLYSRVAPAPDPAAAPAQRGLENALRAGDPTFERYRKLVRLENQDYFTSKNMLGQILASGTGRIVNTGDRALVGVELTGTVYGKDSKVLATSIALPVPRVRERLDPQERMQFTVAIDGIPNGTREGDLWDIRVELTGLAFEE
jgi:hypothetical protein